MIYAPSITADSADFAQSVTLCKYKAQKSPLARFVQAGKGGERQGIKLNVGSNRGDCGLYVRDGAASCRDQPARDDVQVMA